MPKMLAAMLLGGMLLWGLPGAVRAEATAPPLLPSVLTVHIKDFKYRPPTAKVHVGDRVTFVNDDGDAHTVTASDGSFDSAGLDTSGTWQYVFTKAGTFSYFCALHPYMKATIVVAPRGEKPS